VACLHDSDCTSDACDANAHLCDASQCVDHQKDGSETDVDCGGPFCSACGLAQGCLADRDCTTFACDFVSSQCVASTCVDQRQDGTESDVDCGGGACPACGLGRVCGANIDCTSGVCDFVSGQCVASTCADGRQDGNETDVDCGGACQSCADGQGCLANTDCDSGVCDFVVNQCVASTCDDGRQDGSETDVDCGGTCQPCAFGLGCAVDTDCQSNACDGVAFFCDADQCSDNRKDGSETGVDCGGGACPGCGPGDPCNGGGDCASGVCNGFTCE
jgi:hypothetical protein